VGELVALAAAASVIVAGDTGPLHIAAAVGTPVVGLFGPTDPARNGPWAPDDVVVSRVDACHCHHKRSCLIDRWCLADIAVSDVEAAVDRRLAGPARA
jgi:ADP-heptose:LPS heptosyltransferase